MERGENIFKGRGEGNMVTAQIYSSCPYTLAMHERALLYPLTVQAPTSNSARECKHRLLIVQESAIPDPEAAMLQKVRNLSFEHDVG